MYLAAQTYQPKLKQQSFCCSCYGYGPPPLSALWPLNASALKGLKARLKAALRGLKASEGLIQVLPVASQGCPVFDLGKVGNTKLGKLTQSFPKLLGKLARLSFCVGKVGPTVPNNSWESWSIVSRSVWESCPNVPEISGHVGILFPKILGKLAVFSRKFWES